MNGSRRAAGAGIVLLAFVAGVACSPPPSAPALDARRLLDAGEFELAAERFDALIEANPDDAVAVVGWCRAMQRSGRVEAIAPRFEPRDGPGDEVGRGMAALYSGDVASGESELHGALEAYLAAGDVSGEAATRSALGVVEFYFKGDIDTARETLRLAELAASRAGDDVAVAEILTNSASAAIESGDLEEAESAFSRADALFARFELESLRATVLIGLGQVREDRGDPAAALDAYVRAREVLIRRSDAPGLVTVGSNLALVLRRLQRYDEAVAAARSGAEAAKRIDDAEGEARCLEIAAGALLETGRLGDARSALERAAAALGPLEAPRLRAAVETSFGNLELARHDLAAALEHYRRSLGIHRDLDHARGQAADRVNLGNANLAAWRWAAAAREFDAAIALYETGLDDPAPHARALSGLARIEEVLGNHATARDDLRAALELAEASGDRIFEASAHSSLGGLEIRAGNPAEARVHFEAARAIYTAGGEELAAAEATVDIAETLRLEERWQDARRLEDDALRVFERHENARLTGLSLYNLALCDVRLGRAAAAARLLARAEAYHERGADDDTLLDSLILAATIAERRGRVDEALSLLGRAVPLEYTLLERAGGADLATGLRSGRSASRVLAGVLARAGAAEAAFEALESGRARVLRAQMLRALLTAGSSVGDADWQRAHARIALISTRLRDPALLPDERAGLLEELRQAERAAAAVLRDGGADARLVADELDVVAAAIARSLRSGEALVSFLIEPDRAYAWVIREGGVRMVALQHPDRIRVAALQVRTAIEAGGATDPGPAAEDLGRLILGPLEMAIGGIDRLLLVPDTVLLRVPMHAVRHNGAWIAEGFETVVLPSASALRGGPPARPAMPRAETTIVAFGDPDVRAAAPSGKWVLAEAGAGSTRAATALGYGTLPALPGSAEEARAVAELYGADRATVVIGREATEEAFKTWAAGGAAVIHVASHAVADDRVPARSALVFALDEDPREDGLLTVGEIEALRVPGALVVLSACQTAGDRVVSGEGLQGLGRAFLAAGARTVIATQWPVDDRAASAMMREFHAGLLAGHEAATALGRARLALMRSTEPDLAAPQAWAAFVTIGDGSFVLDAPPERVP